MPAPILKVPDSDSVEEWEAYARQRGCYCGLWAKRPETLEKQRLGRGCCGMCERCGRPGHARHFPGPVPYTGAWCDRCYRIVSLTWPLKHWIFWIVIVAGVVMYLRHS